MGHLTVYDIRDLELLLKLQDASELTSAEFADSLGMTADQQAVAQRLAWMRRFGMVEFDEKERTWSLSPGGLRVIAAKRKAAVTDRLEKVPDEQLVDVMAHVTSRYRLGDPVIATLLRREFAYGTAPQSAAWRNGRRS